MNVTKELDGIRSRALGTEFYQDVRCIYEETLCQNRLDDLEKSYNITLPEVLKRLNPEQTTLFHEM